MREILFRGKRTDNREWVEGSLFQSEGWAAIGEDGEKSGCYILEKEPLYTRCFMNGNSALADNEFIQVSEETVGQYTGMKGKNGKRIFEGDVVRFLPERDCVVEWDDGCYWVVPAKPDHPDPLTGSDLQYAYVIGNVHDNPELMEGKK